MKVMQKTGMLCREHGGTCSEMDKHWCCDICATSKFNKCTCGGSARSFGEALFSVVGRENCDEFVSGVEVDTKSLWNSGIRGFQDKH